MRNGLAVLTLVIAMGASIQAHSECARCKLEAAWGLASQPANLFDAKTLARYEGQVMSVQEVAPDSGVVEGVYVLLKTDEGNMSVRLGPKDYLDKQGFKVEPYDRIEVLASKVTTVNDRPALVATKAKLNDKTIALRTGQGEGVWPKKKR